MANDFFTKKIIYNVVGTFLIFNGLIFLAASATVVSTGSDSMPVFLTMLVMGGLPLFGGYKMIKHAKKLLPQAESNTYERDVLKLATSKKGRLTQTDLTINLNLSLEESRRILDMMVIRNIADSEVNEFGSVVYVFRDLLV